MSRTRLDKLIIEGQVVDLPPRVYPHRSKLRFVPRTGRKVTLGSFATLQQYQDSMQRWAEVCREPAPPGTFAKLYEWFLSQIRNEKKLAPRTISDYENAEANLIYSLGHIPAEAMEPHHVATYRDDRGKKAPVRANREIAALGACYTKALEKGKVKMLHPSKRSVRRLPERKRARYITDSEFWTVYDRAVQSVRILMVLQYRTLQRPSDLLKLGPRNLVSIGGKRKLRVKVSKGAARGVLVDIDVVGELGKIVDAHLAAPVVRRTFVHREDGEQYRTRDGIAGMFRRYVEAAELTDYSIYDLKGKGATDMLIAGTPLHIIQRLCGHDSPTTTEKYIKARLPDSTAPNLLEIRRA